jgi:type III pantothenate kinase
MFLALDIGNSTIGMAAFDGRENLANIHVSSTVHRTNDETWDIVQLFLSENHLAHGSIEGIGISSVVPFHTSLFSKLFKDKLHITPLLVNGTLDLGFTIRYEDPSSLGPDRICAAIAAYDKYGGPLIVIDFGTATTYGVVSKNGDFLGGAISLGLKSTADALFKRAAQLPLIELQFPRNVICTDTTSAMQAGTMFGSLDAIEGMVKRIRKELGVDARVVATGGLSTVISKQSSLIDACEPLLVLNGVRLICERLRDRKG